MDTREKFQWIWETFHPACQETFIPPQISMLFTSYRQEIMWKLGYLRETKKTCWLIKKQRNANKRPRGGRRMLWQELKGSNRLVSVYFSSCLVTRCYRVYCCEVTGSQTWVGSFRQSCLPQEPDTTNSSLMPSALQLVNLGSSARMLMSRSSPFIEPSANQLSGPTWAKTTGRKEGRRESLFLRNELHST